jgi:hypothetical protein
VGKKVVWWLGLSGISVISVIRGLNFSINYVDFLLTPSIFYSCLIRGNWLI